MGRAIVVDVIQGEELDVALATTYALEIATAVVHQGGQPIFTEARFSMLVVAYLAPRVRPPAFLSQIELGDRFFLVTLWAVLTLEGISWHALQPADVVQTPGRTRQAVLAAGQVPPHTLNQCPIREI
ncbi:MAG TPA: hypothetical protein VGJ60_06035 [Chloroflexota bacterium]|jgi:hypothetical protein